MFLLSHHGYFEYDRCISFRLKQNTIRICARCTGLYSGLLLGALVSYVYGPWWKASLFLILPLPAFIDWGLYVTHIWIGSNLTRVSSGLVLGFGWYCYFARFMSNHSPFITASLTFFWLALYVYLRKSGRRIGVI